MCVVNDVVTHTAVLIPGFINVLHSMLHCHCILQPTVGFFLARGRHYLSSSHLELPQHAESTTGNGTPAGSGTRSHAHIKRMCWPVSHQEDHRLVYLNLCGKHLNTTLSAVLKGLLLFINKCLSFIILLSIKKYIKYKQAYIIMKFKVVTINS